MKHSLIGKTAQYEVKIQTKNREQESILVDVKVKDYKKVFGHDLFLITPCKGRGEIWVRTLTNPKD